MPDGFACRLTNASLANGVPIPPVSSLPGYGNARVTLRYAHLTEQNIEASWTGVAEATRTRKLRLARISRRGERWRGGGGPFDTRPAARALLGAKGTIGAVLRDPLIPNGGRAAYQETAGPSLQPEKVPSHSV